MGFGRVQFTRTFEFVYKNVNAYQAPSRSEIKDIVVEDCAVAMQDMFGNPFDRRALVEEDVGALVLIKPVREIDIVPIQCRAAVERTTGGEQSAEGCECFERIVEMFDHFTTDDEIVPIGQDCFVGMEERIVQVDAVAMLAQHVGDHRPRPGSEIQA